MVMRFTEEHEWVRLDGDVATIGITKHAAEQLGDFVFVELPKVGATLDRGAAAAVVESVKAASDVYAPLAGEVVEVNDGAVEDPAMVGTDPEGKGWLYRMKLQDPGALDGLLDEQAYAALVA